ncbi:HAD-like protein [Dichomitus squalens LYAD-421 SS1]|uniref:HAD-like protein n=1 Tax=Dichomitus squalens (strain LYAD-421) TaxID=732165 RepID=R7T0F5_DICSQ|nr:HAD-like protein [Dichomitus squalens LYAD-421 SS1]EJF61831.1 HAD-like protein [Dichomitus squalens LYAD-421 SS1]
MSYNKETTFAADAVLFDMDGTLTDSIAAVEAAWGKVAKDLGLNPAYVIAATHGKRAVDNLAQFKPHIKVHEMDAEVQSFEESILFFADAFTKHGPGSREVSPLSSGAATPSLASSSSSSSSTSSSGSGVVSPCSASLSTADYTHRPSFVRHITNRLALITAEGATYEHEENEGPMIDWRMELEQKHIFEAWQVEAAAVDRSVRILPGVKKLMDSIPESRYAVATSGAKNYAYGCMTRVGITPPKVTITADDKRLKAGKPAPDPFLLAAKELGFDAKRCVVFEDSPSGIRAGVASGATVIAVCTSHERSKIENCGAHFIVDTMEQVRIVVDRDGLKFVVSERQ